MVDFYFDKDLDIKTLNTGYSLKFTDNNLDVSLFDVKQIAHTNVLSLKKILFSGNEETIT